MIWNHRFDRLRLYRASSRNGTTHTQKVAHFQDLMRNSAGDGTFVASGYQLTADGSRHNCNKLNALGFGNARDRKLVGLRDGSGPSD